jgi:methyltransferase-like protein 6
VYPAYQKWIDNSKVCLEVGCGHGCSIYPLLGHDEIPDIRMIATDYSCEALSILMMHAQFDPSRLSVRLWDITKPYEESVEYPTGNHADDALIASTEGGCPNDHAVDSVLCLFVLSALHCKDHETALRHIWSILPPGGAVLFRDYGVCDMTMFRHKTRLSEHLYRRSDHTLSYYFDLEYVRHLCGVVGFDPVELKYATVQITNKKKGIVMKRVFVHAVLVKVE